METEANTLRMRYRLCRSALLLAGLATGLMAADTAGHAALLVLPDRRMAFRLAQFLMGPGWQWAAGTTIVISALLGSLLLRGRFDTPSWRSRTTSLILLAFLGLTLWAIHHGDALGIGHEPEHGWLRDFLRLGARWAWMAILASLAADLALHLGREEATDSRASLYALIAGGTVVWILQFLHMTDWLRGWPLQARMQLVPLTWLLYLAHTAIRSLACFLLTVLCLLAARACTGLLQEIVRAEKADHLFGGPNSTNRQVPDNRQSDPFDTARSRER